MIKRPELELELSPQEIEKMRGKAQKMIDDMRHDKIKTATMDFAEIMLAQKLTPPEALMAACFFLAGIIEAPNAPKSVKETTIDSIPNIIRGYVAIPMPMKVR